MDGRRHRVCLASGDSFCPSSLRELVTRILRSTPGEQRRRRCRVLECVRMVATDIEMAAPGFAPVTPPQRVSTAPSSPLGGPGIELHEVCSAAVADGLPGIGADAEVLGGVVADGAQTGTGADSASFGAVASGILDEEGQSAVADVLQPGIDADAEVLAAVASGTLDEEGQYQEKLPPLMVLSPVTRLRCKAAAPLVRKRSQKYCQNEDCVFNRMVPGQPARKDWHEQFCTWCDDSMLTKALQKPQTEMHVKQALSMFKEKSAHVYRLALQKLEGHELSDNRRLCLGTGCVYSMSNPGTTARARAASDFCTWCQPEYLEIAKLTVGGRQRLNQALSAFKTNPQVYDAALAKVGEGFVRAARLCCNTGCMFSYSAPGQRCGARQRNQVRVSDLCFWRSPEVVSRAESTAVGLQRIARDLRKFGSFPEVFHAATRKLSSEFLQDLCIASREAESKAMLKEDRVEQCKQGRYYLEYMTDRARTYWEPPSPYYDGLVCHKHKGWFRPDADDNEPKMVRKWLTESQFLHGRTQKEPRFVSEKFPHVSGNALRTQYLREKPGQLSCATCGHVYLWRSKPKL